MQLQNVTNCYVAINEISKLDVDNCLQGEQGDDGKVEGPPGPQGDIVSHTKLHHLPLCCEIQIEKFTVYSHNHCLNRVLWETEERGESQEIQVTRYVILHDFQRVIFLLFLRLIYCRCLSGSSRCGWRKRPTWSSRTTCRCSNLMMTSMLRSVNRYALAIRHLDICLVIYRDIPDPVDNKDLKALKEIK